MKYFDIPYYQDYISNELAQDLLKNSIPVHGVDQLTQVGVNAGLETKEALQFLTDLYLQLKTELEKVLQQRIRDRKFIDERVRACYELNKKLAHDFLSPEYQTVIGLEDATGRIVIGPKNTDYCNRIQNKPIAPIPEFMQGPHVTLFGPPGTAKMAINAMNTFHRKLKDEPAIVEHLLKSHTGTAKWGADDEDSKTPLRSDLVSSAVNLTKCFEGKLSYYDEENGKTYELASSHLAAPIKRFPGLALPCSFLFYQKSPIPLHLYDFALHLFHNWKLPQSLVFYVPKLENEEEALYIKNMVATAESMIQKLHPEYVLGTVRLMIVLENPRAILRTHEIIDNLYPYFIGASLGWHDYLGSTARLFKEDGNYRIPVKADPDIVIKYIKASHTLLSDVVGSRGGIRVGGMYGILPLENDSKSESFQITIKGYIKDIVTQMKRNLTGFWVAHPDFVRLGIALVEAWKLHSEGNSKPLFELVEQLLNKKYHQEVFDFINNPDLAGLDKNDPNYVRSLIVADIKESDFIANNHPEEIRYNIFQSLQYLTDWLCGNGCVALPAHVHGVAVRVMDDLATAERSRWEVWHEIYHGRFSLEQFLKITFEEYQFIRKDQSNNDKIVQVKWNEQTEKWYPVALKIMIQLMTAKNPVEFATELLIPFTIEKIRNAENPLKALEQIDPNKIKLSDYIERFIYYFEVCGCESFASQMAKNVAIDLQQAETLIKSFNLNEINEAASFHGNIGESKKTLDHFAAAEQALVFTEQEATKKKLIELGSLYENKFGVKFLISAKGRSGAELLTHLQSRLINSKEQELSNSREALWEISKKRLTEKKLNQLTEKLDELKIKHGIADVSIAITKNFNIQSIGSKKWFELASLSKTLASAFAVDYFNINNISLDSSINDLFKNAKSSFRLNHPEWGHKVSIRQLLSHSALNMHYVKGFELGKKMPLVSDLLKPDNNFGYTSIDVISEPGKEFHYSGGGFIVLEHLIQEIEQKPIQQLTENFLNVLGQNELSFNQENMQNIDYATGFSDDGSPLPSKRLMFPAFAAGAMGTAKGMAEFLKHLSLAFNQLDGSSLISHDVAIEMLYGTDKGCREFMGTDMGLGVFVAECGDNKLALHQGANEGFRCLYVQCFSGPNKGDGFVILCNADNKGVSYISEAAQIILRELNIEGINYNKFKTNFDYKNIQQEQIVNLGYKQLIFEAFEPTLPEEITFKGPKDPLSEFNLLTQAKVLSTSNQKFARATNMISSYLPTFDPELFGRQGKIMDSWESSRHNPYPCDHVILELPTANTFQYASLSTEFHDGNQAEYVRILGFNESDKKWTEILAKTQMLGHAYINVKLAPTTAHFKKIKIEMYPDGGLSRVGLYSALPQNIAVQFLPLEKTKSQRFVSQIPKTLKPLSLKYHVTNEKILRNKIIYKNENKKINLAGLAFGAKIISATNEHYSPAVQVISPFPAINMFDGLESARSRKPNNFEEVIIQLAETSELEKIILNFEYFVNNNPLAVSIDGLTEDNQWIQLIEKTVVKGYAGNIKEFKVLKKYKFQHLKLQTWPDGGINRIEVY